MRFVWAVVAFVLATVMIGAGIAQRTVLAGPETEHRRIDVEQSAPYILVDGAVLNAHGGAQKLRAEGDGTIFAAYGRTADLEAWLAKTDYVQVTAAARGAGITSKSVPVDPDATSDGEPQVLDPTDSDLWLEQFQKDDVLVTDLALPADMSLLLASDGVGPAPSDLSVSWPTDAVTPWAGPLIVGGAILLAIGLVLYLLGLRNVRRSRGPRRKGIPMPVTEPIDLSATRADRGVISATPARRPLGAGKRGLIAIPAVALSALLFAGCDATAWPQLTATPSPTPSESVIVPDGQGAPAVTEAQAGEIVSRIAATVADADSSNDADKAAQRLSGPMLDERKTEYTLKAAIADRNALAAIPSGPIARLLPQAYDGWPRTFLAVVEEADSPNSTIMTVTQQDPWSHYRLEYSASLAAGASMTLAPSYVGAVAVEPTSPFLVMAPADLAAAYADVLDKGKDSSYAAQFDDKSDALRTEVASDRQKRTDDFNQTGRETGQLTFASAAGTYDPVALATLDSGAIVAVNVTESDTVRPTNPDAVIKLGTNQLVSTLTGKTESATGFTTTWSDQVYFFVPAQSSSGRIQYLGHSSEILSAQEVTP